MLKQGFITLALFNILNISFSTGVQLKYTSYNDTNFIINIFVIAVAFLFIVGSTFAM
jgi:hypothetical protein